MRVFTFYLYGDSQKVAGTIGEIAFQLKAPLFLFPESKSLDYGNEIEMRYPTSINICKTSKQVVTALEPKGQGYKLKHPRLGIFRPLVWERDEGETDIHTEIVGYLDFSPRPFSRHPNLVEITEIESYSNFLDSLVANFRNVFEKRGYLRDIENYKIRHITTRYADVQTDNQELFREINELKNELSEIVEIRARVEKLEEEAQDNAAKRDELETLREQIFLPSNRLPSQQLSIEQERLNTLLQTQRMHYRNLNEMEKRAANFGIDVPIPIVNQIDYFRSKIEEIQVEIDTL